MDMRVSEAIKFFRTYGIKCDENDKFVEEWLNSSPIRKGSRDPFSEDDLDDFNDWCRWKGTAYEKGIDDETKIKRLLEEISELKSEIDALRKENNELEVRLGVNYF